jgi:CIC family chloride channel protein
MLCPESIYSMKLARRGRFVPESLRASPHELRRAADVMNRAGASLPASSSLDRAVHEFSEHADFSWFLAVEGEDVVGPATRADVLGARGEQGGAGRLGEVARRDYVRVGPRASLPRVVDALRAARSSIALVLEPGAPLRADAVQGIVTKTEIANALLEARAAFQG